MTSSAIKGLFGDTITAIMPCRLLDASDIRQVPDTQEVFLYPESSVSIVVEILERVEPNTFADAIRFHFMSLAHDNSAQSSVVHEIMVVPNDRGDNTPSAIVLAGTQKVPKFNRTNPDEVRVLMAIYRVESKNIDVVVTFNIPVKSEDDGAVGEEGWAAAKADFDAFVTSLKIVDFGLFV